jgi:hypothetical protein
MNEIEKKFIAALGPEYDHSAKPTVYFYDYACKKDGVYVNAVYISKRSKTAHDTQDFRRKANDEDKLEFPQEWEYYLKVRENMRYPKIDLIPGIDQASLMTLKDEGIYNLEQLADTDNEWSEVARRILNAISTESGEGRNGVSGDNQAPVRVLEGNRAGQRGTSNGSPQKGFKKTWQESHPQEVTFNFEVIQ